MNGETGTVYIVYALEWISLHGLNALFKIGWAKKNFWWGNFFETFFFTHYDEDAITRKA